MTIRFGYVSTYPPTLCGLASFTASLRQAIATQTGTPAGAVAEVIEVPAPPAGPEVVAQLVHGDSASAELVGSALADVDVVVLQHEYGIFGGPDGDEVLPLLDRFAALGVPTLVVLHTVLSEPRAYQRAVLERVVATADAVVVMTPTARDRLATGYAVDMGKVSLIPHGASALPEVHAPAVRSARPTVLTWGLLGPGKGIEWGIEAMALLGELNPRPRYIVSGQTHPKVVRHAGEAYRETLQARVRELGLTDVVEFRGEYQHPAALAELVESADVVLLPYDSTDQVTSGVLSEAVTAGKRVIATRFPHALELLADGEGLLVPQKDPVAIAAAIRTALAAGAPVAHHNVPAEGMLWPVVAARYVELAQSLRRARVAA